MQVAEHSAKTLSMLERFKDFGAIVAAVAKVSSPWHQLNPNDLNRNGQFSCESEISLCQLSQISFCFVPKRNLRCLSIVLKVYVQTTIDTEHYTVT